MRRQWISLIIPFMCGIEQISSKFSVVPKLVNHVIDTKLFSIHTHVTLDLENSDLTLFDIVTHMILQQQTNWLILVAPQVHVFSILLDVSVYNVLFWCFVSWTVNAADNKQRDKNMTAIKITIDPWVHSFTILLPKRVCKVQCVPLWKYCIIATCWILTKRFIVSLLSNGQLFCLMLCKNVFITIMSLWNPF